LMSVKRREFTPSEDEAIVTHVRASYLPLKSNRLWEQLEESGNLHGRSWKTIKNRYMNKLAPRISPKRKLGRLQTKKVRSLLEPRSAPFSDTEEKREYRLGGSDSDPQEEDREVSDQSVDGSQQNKTRPQGHWMPSSASMSSSPGVSFVPSSPQSSSSSSRSSLTPLNDSEMEKAHQVTQCVKYMCRTTGHNAPVIFHALFVCSGNVANAVKYLRGNEDSFHVWTHTDDMVLNGAFVDDTEVDTAIEQLIRQHGDSAVHERTLFLEG